MGWGRSASGVRLKNSHPYQVYVDTFEEEEEIDLGSIALELQSMDRDMEESDRLIQGFCDELGIEVPL